MIAPAASDGEPTKARDEPSTVAPPAQIEPSQPQLAVETSAAEVSLTGTDGARILPFPAPTPVSAHVSKTEKQTEQKDDSGPAQDGVFAHVSNIDSSSAISTLWTVGEEIVWRVKKIVRDKSYPNVTARGFFFRKDSGGFVLIRRADRKIVGFFTKQAIKDLEERYGSKIKRKSRRA